MRTFHFEGCWQVTTDSIRKSNHRVERTATSRLAFDAVRSHECRRIQPELAVGGRRSPGSFSECVENMTSSFFSDCRPLSPLRRFVSMGVVAILALELYLITAWFPLTSPTVVEMPSWVPFLPAFTLPYLGMLLMTWILPVAIRDGARFRACIWAFTCSFLLVLPLWIFMPTTLIRPNVPDGWWLGPYRWLVAVDPPNNVMPCAHGLGPMIGAWFLGLDRTAWRWPLGALLLLGMSSIALIWQHRPVDILIGIVAAAVGITFGEAVERSRRKSE